MRAAFAANDNPIDSFKREIGDGTEERFDREKAHVGRNAL
jgi:hypothetical protein